MATGKAGAGCVCPRAVTARAMPAAPANQSRRETSWEIISVLPGPAHFVSGRISKEYTTSGPVAIRAGSGGRAQRTRRHRCADTYLLFAAAPAEGRASEQARQFLEGIQLLLRAEGGAIPLLHLVFLGQIGRATCR